MSTAEATSLSSQVHLTAYTFLFDRISFLPITAVTIKCPIANALKLIPETAVTNSCLITQDCYSSRIGNSTTCSEKFFYTGCPLSHYCLVEPKCKALSDWELNSPRLVLHQFMALITKSKKYPLNKDTCRVF